jgi:aminoglycoside phosphotransferase (APT) family kinase protein
LVAEVDEKWIFRFPKDDTYRFGQEQKVLAALRGRVRVPIPQVEFLGKSRRVMGYQKIVGRHVTEQEWTSWPDEKVRTLAGDLAGFLWDCHRAIPVKQAQSWGLPKERMTERYHRVKDRIPELARFGLAEFAQRTLSDYEKLGDGERTFFLYNDLHTENFVVDVRGRLAGVFDFGDFNWGDPDWEFGYLYRYDKRLFEACVEEYERLSGLIIRKRACAVYAWLDALFDLAELWNQPENSAHKNGLRWAKRFMQRQEEYL